MLTQYAALISLLLIASPPCAAYITVYGSPTYTPGVGGFKGGDVAGINSAGTAVGFANNYTAFGAFNAIRAVRWDASGATELGFIGIGSASVETRAYAINGAGTAVGYSSKSDAL